MRVGITVLLAVLLIAAPAHADDLVRWLDTVAGENGRRYRRGDLWGSVGAWFSGRWWNEPARGYIREVKRRLRERTWRTRDFRGG